MAQITLGGNVRYEPCKYSYRELAETKDILESFFLSEGTPAIEDSVYGIANSGGKENRIVVYLKEYTDESIMEYKSSFLDLKCIVFTQGFPAFLE
ncbi:MAG: hypothetical protein FWG10_13110 [Eubacteriaceae bacterium]|nr:hypothetical protein [Eubacteriaceae bacterium]